MQEASKYCRFCLEDLHPERHKSVYKIEGDLDTLLDQMQNLFNLSTSTTIYTPKQACLNCVSVLEFCITFLLKLRRIEELFNKGCTIQEVLKEVCEKPENLHKELENQQEGVSVEDGKREAIAGNHQGHVAENLEKEPGQLVQFENMTNGELIENVATKADNSINGARNDLNSVCSTAPSSTVLNLEHGHREEKEMYPWRIPRKKMRQILPKVEMEMMPLDMSNLKMPLVSLQGGSSNQVMIPVTLKTVCRFCKKTVMASSMAEFKKHTCQESLECEINDCRKKFFGKHSLAKHQKSAHYHRKSTKPIVPVIQVEGGHGRLDGHISSSNGKADRYEIAASLINTQSSAAAGENLIPLSPGAAVNLTSEQSSRLAGQALQKGEKIVLETMVSVQPAPTGSQSHSQATPIFPSTTNQQQSVIYLQPVPLHHQTPSASVSSSISSIAPYRVLTADKSSQPRFSGDPNSDGLSPLDLKPRQVTLSPGLEIMKYEVRPLEPHRQLVRTSNNSLVTASQSLFSTIDRHRTTEPVDSLIPLVRTTYAPASISIGPTTQVTSTLQEAVSLSSLPTLPVSSYANACDTISYPPNRSSDTMSYPTSTSCDTMSYPPNRSSDTISFQSSRFSDTISYHPTRTSDVIAYHPTRSSDSTIIYQPSRPSETIVYHPGQTIDTMSYQPTKTSSSNRVLDIVEKCMQQIEDDQPVDPPSLQQEIEQSTKALSEDLDQPSHRLAGALGQPPYTQQIVYHTQLNPVKEDASPESSQKKDDNLTESQDYESRIHELFLLEKSRDEQEMTLQAVGQPELPGSLPAVSVSQAVRKPFKCTYAGCNKAYHRKAVFIAHERIHTGERPFTCENCGRGFSRIIDKKKHKLLNVCMSK